MPDPRRNAGTLRGIPLYIPTLWDYTHSPTLATTLVASAVAIGGSVVAAVQSPASIAVQPLQAIIVAAIGTASGALVIPVVKMYFADRRERKRMADQQLRWEREHAREVEAEKWERHGLADKLNTLTVKVRALDDENKGLAARASTAEAKAHAAEAKANRLAAENERLAHDLAQTRDRVEVVAKAVPVDFPPPAPPSSKAVQRASDSGIGLTADDKD